MNCSHCYCKKVPATTDKPEHLVCCKCRDRVAVSGSHPHPWQHRLYPTVEEERAFREVKERYGIKD